MKHQVLLVNGLAGLFLILIMMLYFALQPAQATETPTIVVTVRGNHYQPAFIQVPRGKPFKLQFVQEDTSPCAADVLFPQLNIGYRLAPHQRIEVAMPAMPKGEIDFTCQSGAYRGRIEVI